MVSNRDDVIDSREVIERIAELEDVLADLAEDDIADDFADDIAELATLRALQEEAQVSPDWPYGETLIRDSYFEEYAQQLADELGLIDGDAHWPLTCIDWKQAARELQNDYTPVDFDSVTYWIRY